jgi:hypothetical protein
MPAEEEKNPAHAKKKPSLAKRIIPWATPALGAIGVIITVWQDRKTDVVTPYQQQVHAACNRIQQVEIATGQTLAQDLAMSAPPGGFPLRSDSSGPALVMPTLLVNRAAVLPALQSNYDSTKLEFDLLDQRTVPEALKDQKTRQEAAKDRYLVILRTNLEKARHDLPDQPTVTQVAALFADPAAAVDVNDAMSALAGGDCTVTPPTRPSATTVGG